MRKIKVKILQSIAGMGDPRPKEELDVKYARAIQQMNRGRRNKLSDEYITELLTGWKQTDRYGEKPLGFATDFAFKPGDEPMIQEDLARKWEDSGVCVIVRDEKKAA